MKIAILASVAAALIAYLMRPNNNKQPSKKNKQASKNTQKTKQKTKPVRAKTKPVITKSASTISKTGLKTEKPTFRCVIIVPGLLSCKAAQAMRNKPVLMNEAPVLPLSGCIEEKCDCKYTRHEDRRMHNRRETSITARQIAGDNENKRENNDRRKSAG